MSMVSRRAGLSGAASTAPCTVLKSPEPSAATTTRSPVKPAGRVLVRNLHAAAPVRPAKPGATITPGSISTRYAPVMGEAARIDRHRAVAHDDRVHVEPFAEAADDESTRRLRGVDRVNEVASRFVEHAHETGGAAFRWSIEHQGQRCIDVDAGRARRGHEPRRCLRHAVRAVSVATVSSVKRSAVGLNARHGTDEGASAERRVQGSERREHDAQTVDRIAPGSFHRVNRNVTSEQCLPSNLRI